jgi:urocanate hydratase
MATTVSGARVVRAPRGTELSCKSWLQEAALRMLMNNLDPEVAERPDDLVVYGGIGKAARTGRASTRSWTRCGARERRDAARAVGQARGGLPHARGRAARADLELAARCRLGDLGALLRARPQGPDDVRPDDRGLRGSTSAPRASSRGTYETFAEAARQHFGGSLRGRLVDDGGLGGMGGAQPLGRDHERRRR